MFSGLKPLVNFTLDVSLEHLPDTAHSNRPSAVACGPGSRSPTMSSGKMSVSKQISSDVPCTVLSTSLAFSRSGATDAVMLPSGARRARLTSFQVSPPTLAASNCSALTSRIPRRATSSTFRFPPISTVVSPTIFTAASIPSTSADGSVSATPSRCASRTASSKLFPASMASRMTVVVEFSTPRNPRSSSAGSVLAKQREDGHTVHHGGFVQEPPVLRSRPVPSARATHEPPGPCWR